MRNTRKGQVSMSLDIRRQAGGEPHREVEFVAGQDRVVLCKAQQGVGRGAAAVARLRRARPRTTLGTDEILALTRGE